jgi:glycosyltransferase involved in cell wall biosynthesis
MSLVSIVMPTHNRLALLRLAVHSVRVQTLADWELIVVDVGSADGTTAWLAGLDDPRVRILALPQTGDVGRLRNQGVQHATGEYVAFLDSDDLWHPAKLQSQLPRMRAAGVPWSYTRYDHIDEAGTVMAARAGEWRELSGWIAHDLIADRTAASIVTVVMQRRFFHDIGGFTDGMRTREDFDLVLRAALGGRTLALPECLAHVRQHAGRTTAGVPAAVLHEASAAMFGRLAARMTDPHIRRAARRKRTHHLAQAGAAHVRAGAPLRAARCYAHALSSVITG